MTEPKKSNLNTVLILILTGMAAVAGAFGMFILTGMKDDLKEIRSSVMPRHEIELQIESIRAEQSRCRSDNLDLRARVVALEQKARP